MCARISGVRLEYLTGNWPCRPIRDVTWCDDLINTLISGCSHFDTCESQINCTDPVITYNACVGKGYENDEF
jgi:hypothetical protein